MVAVADNAILAVIESLSGGEKEDDFWDAGYQEDDTWLKMWAGDWWLTGPEVTFARGQAAAKANAGVPDGDILSIARSQLGGSYVWAAENPRGPEGGPGWAFDCSGFTKYVLEQAGLSNIPHMASLQQQMFPKVGRDELQAGDLVFFAIPGGNYKGPNTASHVGIYVGNGKMIDASSSLDAITERPVFWEYFIGGGSTGMSAGAVTSEARPRKAKKEAVPDPALPDLTMVPASLGGNPDMAWMTFGLEAGIRDEVLRGQGKEPPFTDSAVKRQLYEGFMDAGRPDLARMVKTKDFATWIAAETGRKDWGSSPEAASIVSKYYPGHGRNAGLFQFALLDRDWVWQDVDQSNWTYGATPYQQARMVVQYFDLSTADIRRYASQIRSGTYHGWG